MQLPSRLNDGGVSLLLSHDLAPGASEVRVKGVASRGHMDFVAAEVPGGTAEQTRVLAALPRRPALALADFFGTTFLASSLYDVFPLAIAGIACARVTGEDYLSFVRRRTRMQVQHDIRGVHKFLMKIVSAKMVASRLPRLITQYLNFGETTVVSSSAELVRARVDNVPLPLGAWLGTVIDAYMIGVLHIAGADNARVETRCVIDEGQASTHLEVDVHFD